MKKRLVLDCTLRDGGYCNNWKFGKDNIEKTIRFLDYAGIDIIECGYLDQNTEKDYNSSKYSSFADVDNILEGSNADKLYLCMIDYGKFDIQNIPDCKDTKLDGIRVAFHKKDRSEAIEFCQKLIKKNYLVFVQPMVTLSYSQNELSDLISAVNNIMPFAMYIVDSFGVMRESDMLEYLAIFSTELDKDIYLGYHSHNNMQLSFSNAKKFLETQEYNTIIDATVFGMGRGAGNLNTELVVEYLNNLYSSKYEIEHILNIYTDILSVFFCKRPWGYSIHNFLSAKYNCHPNYSIYLNDKHTLTAGDINSILSQIPTEKKESFDEQFLEQMYEMYMNRQSSTEKNTDILIEQLTNKRILIILPGQSSEEHIEKIQEIIDKETIVFTVNFSDNRIRSDYVFVSNIRRYVDRTKSSQYKYVVTSNVQAMDAYACLDYELLTNDVKYVKDNAALLLLKFLIRCNVKEVYVAGLDGYSYDFDENYGYNINPIVESKENIDRKNSGVEEVLNQYAKQMPIFLATPEKHIHLRSVYHEDCNQNSRS